MEKNNIKVALVHDFLVDYGGAERVLEVLSETFPEAPIYTLLYDKEKMGEKFKGKIIHTSFLQKFPKFLRKRKKWMLPFMMVAPETFNLRDFDLVISSSGAWTKGIITRLNTTHISYVHSPIRFAWDENEEYLVQQGRKKIIGFFARFVLGYIRVWDKIAADRPDYLISNSQYTKRRIKKYYGIESEVIYPPIHISYNIKHIAQNDVNEVLNNKYFLIVSRLSPYKKIDAAVEAFNKLELPLVIVGTGEQEKYLKSIAGNNIKFLGFQPDEKLPEIYENARAFVFPGVDDFGIAPVEAMSCGVPVLAIKSGGILETVEEGKTGEFFEYATPEVIADAVRRFMEKEDVFDRRYIAESAKRFTKEIFVEKFKNYIKDRLDNKSAE